MRRHALVSILAIFASTTSNFVFADEWYCPQGQVSYHPYSCLRNFYVDQSWGNDRNSGSQYSPWATIQAANNSGQLRAGDCVNVAAGNYVQWGSGYNALNLTAGGNSNSQTGFVTYISASNHATTISGNSSLINLINIEAPYIIIDGFDIDASGISGTAVNSVTSQGHHLDVINNKIHDAGAAGIGFGHTDYLLAYGNNIYNNADRNLGRASGISIYEPAQVSGFTLTSADYTNFHILIQNNVIAGNTTQNICDGQPAGCIMSDGNGIIADDWLDVQNWPYVQYPYYGLIQSNLIYNNGGPGFQAFSSANLVVANNTVYNNNLNPLLINSARGELSAQGSNNITFINNIMYAFPVWWSPELQYNSAALEGQLVWDVSNYSNINWTNNITFNGTVGQASANFQTPTYVSDLSTFVANNRAGVWPQLTPYIPAASSPAIGTGTSTPSYPPKSLCGQQMSTPPNIGAY